MSSINSGHIRFRCHGCKKLVDYYCVGLRGWAYTINDRRYCSYNCMRAEERQIIKKRQERRAAAQERSRLAHNAKRCALIHRHREEKKRAAEVCAVE